jgi:hypothetical protein
LGKNSPFVFKTTTLFLYMCSQLLFWPKLLVFFL